MTNTNSNKINNIYAREAGTIVIIGVNNFNGYYEYENLEIVNENGAMELNGVRGLISEAELSRKYEHIGFYA